MRRLCSILAACGLLWSTAASAATTTYAIDAPVRAWWDGGSVEGLPAGLTGRFTINDSAFTATPGLYDYPAAFSGTFHFGASTITIADGLTYVYDWPSQGTQLTMLGGNRWNTGGTITETAPAGELVLAGLQLMFYYPDELPINTPIGTLLAIPSPNRSLTMVFRAPDGSDVVASWEITSISPVPEPASVTMLLAGGVLLGAVALRRRATGSVA